MSDESLKDYSLPLLFRPSLLTHKSTPEEPLIFSVCLFFGTVSYLFGKYLRFYSSRALEASVKTNDDKRLIGSYVRLTRLRRDSGHGLWKSPKKGRRKTIRDLLCISVSLQVPTCVVPP